MATAERDDGPRSSDDAPDGAAERRRAELVAGLEAAGAVETPSVRAAFLAVRREAFLPPGVDPAAAHRDEPVPTKRDARGAPVSSSSQPRIMAAMLERLDARSGHRVLEVGAGTGYNAALLAYLVGPTGRVTTVDVDPELAARAGEVLATEGYRDVAVAAADGREGFLPGAPYDRIVVTASSPEVPRPWFDQLAPGGLVELPLRLSTSVGAQAVVTLAREGPGLRSVAVVPGAFMALRPAAEADAPQGDVLHAGEVVAGAAGSLGQLTGDALRTLAPPARRRLLGSLLAGPARRRRVLAGRPDEGAVAPPPAAAPPSGLATFLALAVPGDRLVEAWAPRRWGTPAGGAPPPSAWPRPALVDRAGHGLAVAEERDADGSVAVAAHGDPAPAEALAGLVREWAALGRPGADRLVVSVAYGGRRPRRRAWRTERRGGCWLSFDWRPQTP